MIILLGEIGYWKFSSVHNCLEGFHINWAAVVFAELSVCTALQLPWVVCKPIHCYAAPNFIMQSSDFDTMGC